LIDLFNYVSRVIHEFDKIDRSLHSDYI